MKTKVLFKIGYVSIFVFMVIAAYLWYLYFKNSFGPEHDIALEFQSGNSINYINATIDDVDEAIPTYYFRVKNNVDKKIDYKILLEQTQGNDGCTPATTFLPSEIVYELKKDNIIISTGLLSELSNNVLVENSINGNSTNDYSLRIRLDEDIENYLDKHFHYVVKLGE